MSELHDVIWERIHYYGGSHNLSVAIEAEMIKFNWHKSGDPFIKPKKCMWEKWEINYLLLYSHCCSQKNIASRINRTYQSVRQKFYYLNKNGVIY